MMDLLYKLLKLPDQLSIKEKGKMKKLILLILLLTAEATFGKNPEFSHDVTGAVKPWTNENFPALSVNDGDFSFAVIPDRTGRPRKGVFESAMKKINMLRPDFAVSVGDLIEGSPAEATTSAPVDAQWKNVRAMTESLKMPFFYCVGNHDINRNTPKNTKRFTITRNAWIKNFGGQTYYSFVYRNVLFMIMNSMEDGDTSFSPEPFSAAQQKWALETLKKHPGVRWTFVFMHHPKFHHKSFNAIEQELRKRNYTVFSGDWHRYTRFRRYGRNYYVVSTCGGVVPETGKTAIPAPRGPEYGEMDHIVWITMTGSGPEIVNILLDGIVPDDVVTQNKAKVPVRKKLDIE